MHLLNANNRSTRKGCKICSKLIITTHERRHWRSSGTFTVNFKHISDLFLVFLLLLWTGKCANSMLLPLFLWLWAGFWLAAQCTNWIIECTNIQGNILLVKVVETSAKRLYSQFCYSYPANMHLLNVNKRNTKKRCKICSKLIITTRKRRHWCRSSVSIIDFEQVNVCWVNGCRGGTILPPNYISIKIQIRFKIRNLHWKTFSVFQIKIHI